ncbi:MAG: NAD(P)H-binding protein [bacterium]|nr:NAD(P)H-binding protein [bacterium]
MKVLLTGASGFVGQQVLHQLLEAGHQVYALVHQQKSITGAIAIPGDVSVPESIDIRALKGCEAAIHLVGIIREFPSRGITFDRVHVDATRTLLWTCHHAGIKRYVHMSAFGASLKSGAAYQRTKAQAEELVRSSQLKWTIIRPAMILGKNGVFLNTIKRLASLPVIPLIGDGEFIVAPVSVATAASAFAQSLVIAESVGKIYDLAGEILTYQEMMQKLSLKLGRKPRFVHLPLSMMRTLALLFDRFAFFPLTREQIIMLEEAYEPGPPEIYHDLGLQFKWLDDVFDEVIT